MGTIAVDIMTPERLLMQTEADSIIVPAADGELGILPHHAPLLAELQPGEIRLRRGPNVEIFAVSGGFLEVEKNHVLIFAETAEMAGEIDAERARQAAERAKAAMKTARTDVDHFEAEASLRRALARLRTSETVRHRPKPAYR